MERLLLDELEKWKNKKRRKPLIIQGARQVGKTWIMKEFGNRYFKDVVYINFDNNERMKNVFDIDYDVNSKILKGPDSKRKCILLVDDSPMQLRALNELLKNDYLVNGKTEYDLMDGEYVNKHGKRYASSETYEKSLLTKYTKIRQTTKIDSLSQETNKYKLFLGL